MQNDLIAGRYRLEELLGRGGMSEVWVATDTELERRVAVKLLTPNADNARFEREARAVASLGHPNITQLYDYGESDDRPYIVLEYLPGGTLEEHLQQGKPLPDDDVRRIAAELAAGLAHAHSRGVVHRDLKPANVLFDQEGRAKLADFGIARMVAGDGTLTEAGTVLGTAAYISPEQAAGAPASPASDVYSFGVMLYRMLTGRLPFTSNDPLELVALHRDSTPPPLTQFRADAPALLESTATAALAKDPADRPADGAALLAALGVPAGFPSFATAPGAGAADATQVLPAAAATAATYVASAPGPPIGPPGRSKAPLVAIGLLVLVLAGAALAYELTRPASGSTPSTSIPLTFSTPATHAGTQASTAASTAASTIGTTLPTTTAPTTAPQRTTAPATTQPPATTVAPPTTTVAPPTTTELPPTTTQAPPPTTTAPPVTTAGVTTATASP